MKCLQHWYFVGNPFVVFFLNISVTIHRNNSWKVSTHHKLYRSVVSIFPFCIRLWFSCEKPSFVRLYYGFWAKIALILCLFSCSIRVVLWELPVAISRLNKNTKVERALTCWQPQTKNHVVLSNRHWKLNESARGEKKMFINTREKKNWNTQMIQLQVVAKMCFDWNSRKNERFQVVAKLA